MDSFRACSGLEEATRRLELVSTDLAPGETGPKGVERLVAPAPTRFADKEPDQDDEGEGPGSHPEPGF